MAKSSEEPTNRIRDFSERNKIFLEIVAISLSIILATLLIYKAL